MSYLTLTIMYFFTSLLYIFWPIALLVMLTKVSNLKIALPVTIIITISIAALGHPAFLIAGVIVLFISIPFYLIGGYLIW